MSKRKRKLAQDNDALNDFVKGGLLGIFTALILIMLVICGITLFFLKIGLDLENHRDENRRLYYMRAFDSDVVQDLCNKDIIPISVADCANGNIVLRYGDMQNIFEVFVRQHLTHDEVFTLISNYETSCNLPPPAPDTIRCNYQFASTFALRLVFSTTTNQLLYIE